MACSRPTAANSLPCGHHLSTKSLWARPEATAPPKPQNQTAPHSSNSGSLPNALRHCYPCPAPRPQAGLWQSVCRILQRWHRDWSPSRPAGKDLSRQSLYALPATPERLCRCSSSAAMSWSAAPYCIPVSFWISRSDLPSDKVYAGSAPHLSRRHKILEKKPVQWYL